MELEAYNRAEKKKTEGEGYSLAANTANTTEPKPDSQCDKFEILTNTLKLIQDELKSLKTQKPEYRSYRPPGERRPYQRPQPYPKAQTSPGRYPFKRRCYTCGSEYHLARHCDQRPAEAETKPNDQDKTAEKGVKVSGLQNSGLFVPAFVNGLPINCLVDTGATLTIISTKVWETMGCSNLTLSTFDQVISTASGSPIEVTGRTRVQLKVADCSCYVDVIITNIDNELILGLDFMKLMDCQIDVGQETMVIQGRAIKLDSLGYVGIAKEMVQIPPRSEAIIQGKMVESTLGNGRLCIIEPSDSFLKKGNAMVAKTLVYSQNTVPLRLMNISDEMCSIYPGGNIANAGSVAEVQSVKTKANTSENAVPSHLADLYQRTVEGMNGSHQKQVAHLLNKYSSVFSETDDDIGRTGVLKHKIPTADAQPIKQPLRRVPYHMQKEMDEQIDNMLKKDVITPSKSPWASGIVLVKEKDGSKKLCIDYRRLNVVTIKDAYPLPRIDESLDQLAGSCWFSCLDMNSGYWQVELDTGDRQKTAFISRKGWFEFKVLPFGLCGAPATFERLVEIVLAGLH